MKKLINKIKELLIVNKEDKETLKDYYEEIIDPCFYGDF